MAGQLWAARQRRQASSQVAVPALPFHPSLHSSSQLLVLWTVSSGPPPAGRSKRVRPWVPCTQASATRDRRGVAPRRGCTPSEAPSRGAASTSTCHVFVLVLSLPRSLALPGPPQVPPRSYSMATHQRAAALLRLLLAAAAVAALAAAPAVAAAAKPLPVVLYGESLCDSSAHYIVDVLGAQSRWACMHHDAPCRRASRASREVPQASCAGLHT